MAAKNPFDDLYDQISQLLNFVKTHSLDEIQDEKVPLEIEKRLENVQRKLENFNKISEDIIGLSGVSNEELKMRLDGTSKELPEDGLELIQRGHEIKNEAVKVSDKLEKALQSLSTGSYTALPELPKDKPPLGDKEYTKKRRSKFKRFGGDDKWKPL
jgi:hypothetical protein